MVRVSRLIDQDANIFDGAALIATSERDLFASGLLADARPRRVFLALQLRNETVSPRRVGTLDEFSSRRTPLASGRRRF